MADEETSQKKNNNAISIAEKAIADFVASLYAVKNSGVPVFASTEEGASEAIEKKIYQGLEQVIIVGFTRTDTVMHTKAQTVAKCVFSVAISSPGLLAENALRSTTELACAIISHLDGVQFDAPFSTMFPVIFNGWTHSVDDDGKLLASLEFQGAVNLKF